MSALLNLIRAKRSDCRSHMDGIVALLMQGKLSNSTKKLAADSITNAEKILFDAYTQSQNDAIKNITERWSSQERKK